MTKLWTPNTKKDKVPAFVCRVPTKFGPCGQTFSQDERAKHEAHVVKCARLHEPEIQLAVAARRDPLFSPWDPEFEEWVAVHGRVK